MKIFYLPGLLLYHQAKFSAGYFSFTHILEGFFFIIIKLTALDRNHVLYNSYPISFDIIGGLGTLFVYRDN